MNHRVRHARTAGWRSALRPLILFFAALVALPLLIPISSAPAFAAGNGTTNAGARYGTGNGYWIGSYKFGSGEIVFCAADNQAGPPDGITWGGSWKPEYKAATVRTSWTGVHGPNIWNGREQGPGPGATGTTLTGRNLQRMSYVMSKWGDTTNNNRARALKRLLVDRFGVMTHGQDANTQDVASLATEMWAEAGNFAGPYAARAELKFTSGSVREGYADFGVVMTAGPQAGRGLPGQRISVTLEGPAVWKPTDNVSITNGGKTLTTTTRADQTLNRHYWEARGTGTVRVTTSATGLPEHRWFVREGTVSQYQGIRIQPVVVTARKQEVTARSSALSTQTSFSIKVETQTSSAKAEPGTRITDRLTVGFQNTNDSWQPAGHAVNVVSTLYGPFNSRPTERATVPSGAPRVGSVTTRVTGPGTYTTSALTVREAGYYVWHETIAADDYQTGWSARFGVASETTVVPWEPEISTVTSHERIDEPTTITDELRVSGLQPGTSHTVTSTLWGPLAERPTVSAGIPSGTPRVGTVTTVVNRNGTFRTPGIRVSAPGYYVWTDSMPATASQNAWSSQFGIRSETTLYPASPTVVTQTSDQVAAPGAVITDTLQITGLAPLPRNGYNEVVSTLYGPFETRPEPAATPPADAPVAGSVTTRVGSVPHGETLTVTTEGIEVSEAGYYVWHETIRGRELQHDWVAPFGVVEETTLVRWSPEVVTQTSDQVAAPGAVITDTLEVSGLWPGSSHEVVSTLYGPFTHRPELSSDVPEDAPVVGTVTTVVDGDGTYVTEGIQVDVPGYYVWHETIAEIEQQPEWSAPFGVTAETTLVPWSPHVVTTRSHEVAEPGTELTDHVTVTGLWPGSSHTITSTLYGPLVHRPELSDVLPADTPVVGTVTLTVDADGTYETDPLVISEAGYYVWHEVIDGLTDAVSADELELAAASSDAADLVWMQTPWSAQYGVVDETSLVRWSPEVVTQTSDQVAAPGAVITDTLEVSGLWPGSSHEVVSTLYGPFTQRPELADLVPDDAPVVGTVTTVVDGDGTYVTEGIQVDVPGYYVWHETIAEIEQQGEWYGKFGIPEETTFVPVPPSVPDLPRTGSSVTSYVTVALGAVLFGIVLVGARRRFA